MAFSQTYTIQQICKITRMHKGKPRVAQNSLHLENYLSTKFMEPMDTKFKLVHILKIQPAQINGSFGGSPLG